MEFILEYLKNMNEMTAQDQMFSISKVLMVAHNITRVLFQVCERVYGHPDM